VNGGAALEKGEIERIFYGFAIQAQKELTSKMEQPKKKVVVLAGPTCAGKSAFAIDLAKKIGGEIISADSMQVYKNMNIGTAKPTQQEMEGVPHHLIDIRDVTDAFNVVDFYYEARHCCQQIIAREGVPIVVGGTGFYLRSLLYGPPGGPPSVPELRKLIEEEVERLGVEVMYEKLKQQDPEYVATITKNDKQKIVRGLEIIKLTGSKVSAQKWGQEWIPQNYDFRCWFLHRPRESLYKRIDKRCEQMLKSGFLEEVQELEKQGIRENSSASQAIGYRQALEYLETEQNKQDYKHFVENFKQATRNYAKRQFTWFRKERGFRWLDLELHDHEVALDMVIQDYDAGS
jgi:tRNA dimethylallyltransferase